MTLPLIRPGWPAPPGVVAGTSTRRGGVSTGEFESLNLGTHVGDTGRCVDENRRRLLTGAGLPSEPTWLNQAHSVNVVRNSPASADAPVDAMVTGERGRVCVVMTADCLPVVFAAADGSEVAVAHAGWRGLCAGILEATLAEMRAAPAKVLAWFGPAISQPAFEVGDEVRAQFADRLPGSADCFLPNERGRWQADLYGLARLALSRQGVQSFYGGDFCTHTDEEQFFSYRRDGQCGRMATFVYRAPNA